MSAPAAFDRLALSEDALRADLPDALVEMPRWICWRLGERDGRPTKIPVSPISGRLVGVDTLAGCVAFGRALQFHVQDRTSHGLGFVVTAEDGLVGVDLDHCRDPESGAIAAWAREILERFTGTFAEVTPSQTGLRVWAHGRWRADWHRFAIPGDSGGEVEVYTDRRYFTVSGERLDDRPREIIDCQAALDWLATLKPPNTNGATHHPPSPLGVEASDDDLLERARRAGNGSKFVTLFDRGDCSDYDNDESRADQALVNMLAFWTGPDHARLDRLFRESALMPEKWDRPDYRERTIKTALDGCREFYSWNAHRGASSSAAPKRGPDPTPAPARSTSSAARPKIQLRAELSAVTDDAENALVADPDAGIYSRTHMLVRIVRDTGEHRAGLVRDAGAPVIQPLPLDALRERIDVAAEFVRHDERTKKDRRVLPPMWVASTLASRGSWRFPRLAGVIEAPTLKPNGEILDTPGYDRETGLLYMPSGKFPPIPPRPTREDAQRATARLLEPTLDFPFVSHQMDRAASVDRAACVALMLTLVSRPAVAGCTPLFAIRSTAPGTGKGLLNDVACIVGTGRPAARMTAPRDDNELRKFVTSLALEGTSAVLLDNIDRSLGSPALSAVLTAEEWSDRLLGQNTNVRVPLRAVWIATGNGLVFRGDLARRVIAIDLDAKLEHPEDRTDFRIPDLLAWTRAHRAELLVAALTILRAYHVADRPSHGMPRKGSFEAWDDLVRGACIWVGLGDPCASSVRIRGESDDDLSALGAALQAWIGSLGYPVTCSEVVTAAANNTALRDALTALVGADKLDATRLGYALRKVRGRIVDGLYFARAESTHRPAQWQVVQCNG